MPIGSYFKGKGQEVMASMAKSNGGDTKAAESEFYATANKTGMKPGSKKNSSTIKSGPRAGTKPGSTFARLSK